MNNPTTIKQAPTVFNIGLQISSCVSFSVGKDMPLWMCLYMSLFWGTAPIGGFIGPIISYFKKGNTFHWGRYYVLDGKYYLRKP